MPWNLQEKFYVSALNPHAPLEKLGRGIYGNGTVMAI